MNHLDIENVIIGGISTGAGVALHIALNYPERVTGLILSRVAWEDQPQNKQVQQIFKSLFEHVNAYGAAESKIKFNQSDLFLEVDELNPAVADSLLKQFDYQYVEETCSKFIQIPQDAPNYNREEWRRIEVPTLIIANKVDLIHPYRYGKLLSNYINNSVFREVPSKTISKELHQVRSKEVINEFLRSHYSEAFI